VCVCVCTAGKKYLVKNIRHFINYNLTF